MNMTNKTAVIYVRTASIDQTHTSNSIDTQINGCMKYASENGINIARVFLDIGCSGKNNTKSSHFEELLQFVTTKSKRIDSVLVYQYDRWTRNIEQGLAAEAYLVKNGVELVSTNQKIESSPSGKFIKVVLMASLELDNEIKAARVRESMKMAYLNGKWVWRVPFGYVRNNDSSISINKRHLSQIKEIFHLARCGFSLNDIAEALNKNSKNKYFSTKLVKSIVKNPFYKGIMKSSFSKNLIPGKFAPIVSEEEWQKANEALSF